MVHVEGCSFFKCVLFRRFDLLFCLVVAVVAVTVVVVVVAADMIDVGVLLVRSIFLIFGSV